MICQNLLVGFTRPSSRTLATGSLKFKCKEKWKWLLLWCLYILLIYDIQLIYYPIIISWFLPVQCHWSDLKTTPQMVKLYSRRTEATNHMKNEQISKLLWFFRCLQIFCWFTQILFMFFWFDQKINKTKACLLVVQDLSRIRDIKGHGLRDAKILYGCFLE